MVNTVLCVWSAGYDIVRSGAGVRQGWRTIGVHQEPEGGSVNRVSSKTFRSTTRLRTSLHSRARHRTQVSVRTLLSSFFFSMGPLPVCVHDI